MQDTIYLTGSGQTSFGEHWDASLRDLMQQAMDRALEDSSCTPLDIDMIIVSNMLAEQASQQAHLGALASSLLPHRPPALRVEAACASGSVAVHTACGLLESGKAETVLVVGVEKMTDVPTDVISAGLMGAADAEKDATCGLTFPGIFGLVARRYMHDYGLTREELNSVSALHHAQAVENPFAQFRSAIPADKISESPKVADPLCMLDCSPISDGAAACILSTKHESETQIIASQLTTDTLSIADRPHLTSFNATREAMEHALEEAQMDRSDIRCMELHDCFSIAAIIHLEDMGFAKPGAGVELYQKPDDTLRINMSGGLKACGHPVGATGVKQLIDVRKQLVTSKERYGLAHNIGGAAATCGLHILECTHA